MARKNTLRSLTLLAFLVFAASGWAQNSADSCYYTIDLYDYNGTSFYAGRVLVCQPDGTVSDTIGFPSGWNNTRWYSHNLAVAGDSLMFRYIQTEDIGYNAYNYYISITDADGQNIYSTYGYEAINYENWYGTPYFFSTRTVCPTCLGVRNLMATEVDSANARLIWKSTGAAQYLVTYGYYNNYQTITTTDTSLWITGLQPSYYYDITIRGICGAGDSSTERYYNFMSGPRRTPIVYVKADASYTDSIDGTSWGRAFNNIYDAQDLASRQYELYGFSTDIWVAEGIYNNTVHMYPGQHIYGGFAGNESVGFNLDNRNFEAHPTIIDGNGNTQAVYGYLNDNQTSTMDGFTIQNARYGARLGDNTLLRNCLIRGCSYIGVDASGNTKHVAIDKCRIVSMTSGGGIQAVNVIIDNTLIYNNTGYGVFSNGNVTLRHCDIVGNHGDSQRSFYTSGQAGNDTLINCIVWDNHYSNSSSLPSNANIVALYTASDENFTGTGNILLSHENSGSEIGVNYPKFLMPENGDFRLNMGSACIDAATAISGFSTSDIAGNSRTYGSDPDMGCYESDGTFTCVIPAAFAVSEATSTAVTVAWGSSVAESFTLQWRILGATEWTTVTGITDHQYQFTGLTENTAYETRVKAICSTSSESEYSDIYTFKSACNNPIDAVTLWNSGNYNVSSSVPLRSSSPISISYILVKGEELGYTYRDIDTIGFRAYNTSQPIRTITIALAETELNELQWDVVTQDTTLQFEHVFHGSYTINEGWNNIKFDQSFAYNGMSNLIIMVYDSTGNTDGYCDFYGSYTNRNTLYSYGNNMYDLLYYNTYSTSFCPDIHIGASCDMNPCPSPHIDSVNVSDTLVVIAASNLGSAWTLEYSLYGTDQWTSTTSFSIPTSTLRYDADYMVRLRTICSSSDSSRYAYYRFHTAPYYYEHVYVKADATGTNDGTSWTNAFTDINAAVNAATSCRNYYGNRPDVRVAAGTYYGDTDDDAYNAFTMQAGVNVYGGFAGNEPANYDIAQRDYAANTTILDGRMERRVLNQSSSFYNEDSAAWDGFTIRHGYSDDYGGGVYLRHFGTLRNCVVDSCFGYYGGGIYSSQGSIYGCVVSNCGARTYGNGIYDNSGRVENTTITGCNPLYDYYSNYGALYASNDSVLRCAITYDSGSYYGAARFNNTYIENSLFAHNATHDNSVIYANNCQFVNCDIVDNRTASNYSNTAITGYSTNLTNCIVWGNHSTTGGNNQQLSFSDITIQNCAVQDNTDATNGNIVITNPMFAGADDGDYRLLTGSPCIDAGTSVIIHSTLDLGGNNRYYNNTIDLGCYENNGEAICSRPTSLNVTTAGTAAAVMWNMGTSAQYTELEYKAADATDWTVVSGITAESYIIEGLTTQSSYMVRARNFCDNNTNSSYTAVVNFATTCASSGDDIFFGDSVNYNTTGDLPYMAYFQYNYSQQLFLSSELGNSSKFSSLKLYYNSNEGSQRHLTIYLGHTNRSSFSSSSDFVEGSALTKVFEDTITFHNGANEIPFLQPFTYNGTDNLVLTVIDSVEDAENYYRYFLSHNVNDYLTLNGGGYESFNINEPNYYYLSRHTYRNNVMFVAACDENVCPKPLLVVSSVTDSSAVVTCQSGAGIGSQLQYKRSDADEYITLGSQSSTIPISGLIQNREYTVRMRTICSAGDTSMWNYVTFTTPAKHQSIFYVSTAAAGLADGSSWSNATNDLAYAVATAQAAGDRYHERTSVWVAQGTYTGNFTIERGVNVYGGFAGNESSSYNIALRDFNSHATILDGQHNGTVLVQRNDFSNRDTAAWDGFTIRNGYAPYNYNINNYYGGGVYLRANGILRNSVVSDCYAYYGGGVYASEGSVINCRIEGDSANYGGGIYIDNGTIENCLVANNSASNQYGGIYAYSSYIRSSTVVNNYTASTDDYSGIYDNYTYIYNTIVWGNRNNSGAYSSQLSSGDHLNNCAVEGGSNTTGTLPLTTENSGTIFSPHFVAPSTGVGIAYRGGNWHLAQGSVCANRGNNSFSNINTDLDGNNRVQNDTIDLGCFESQYHSTHLPVYDSIIYVKSVATGNADGSSWDNATDNLNMATQIASAFGIKKVWVAAGTYYGDTSSNNAFTMKAGVNVYGGFAGNEAPNYDLALRNFETNATILDGDYMRRVLYQASNFNRADSVEWNGFTIRNGYPQGSYQNGGGAYIRYYSKLVNCVITSNNAYQAGGVYLAGSTWNKNISGSYLTNYTTALVNCKVIGNTASYYGGVENSNSLVSNCLVAGNTSTGNCGGIHSYGGYIINSTIVKNNSGNNYDGAGVYSEYGFIRNCIIWGNKSGLYSSNLDGYSVSVHNSAIEDADSLISLAATNDGVDPSLFYVRFNDPENGDYTLHPTSACLDLGDSVDSRFLPATDLAGNNRWNGEIDLGCYEGDANNNCPSVIAVTATNITNSTATVTWTPQGSETSWNVRYRQQGTTSDTNFVVTTNTINITGLSLNRTYSVYVRALCIDGSMSAWSIPATFTTLCDTTQLAPLSAFTSMIPANGETVYNSSVDFGWSSIPEATSYDLYLWADGQTPSATPIRTGLTQAGVANVTLALYDNMRGSSYHWYVKAWNECISRNSDTFSINVPYLPNLNVSGFTMTTPVANQSVTIEWTVVNNGNGPTPPGQTWNDYIWLSGHSGVGGGFLYDVDEVLLATVPNLQQLAPGESYTNQTQVQLPRDYQGNFFFFVFADQYSANNIDYTPTNDSILPIPYTPSATGTPYPYLQSQTTSYPGNFIHSQIQETYESDNFFYDVKTILPPPTPDLIVTTINHPLNANSGDTIAIRWQTTNQGDAATTTARWNDAVYISSEEVFSFGNATLLGTAQHEGNLNIGEYYIDSITAVLPLQFSGAYYIYIKADVDDAVYENIYEENNVSRSSQTLNVVMSAPPDLAVDSIGVLPAVLSAKESVTVYYRVSNVGARAVSDGTWYDAVYISSDSVFNTATARRLVMRQQHRSLPMSDSYVASFTFNVPDSINAPRYLYFRTDVEDNVFEYTYEDNNIMGTGAMTVATPDLTAAVVSVPADINTSETVTVTWTVKNIGQGNLNSRMLHDRILFNGQPVYTASQTVTIAAGDSIVKSAVVRLGCTEGTTGTITAETDYRSMIFESNESNNISNGITVNLQSPDLALTNLTVADSDLWSGRGATVSWNLANNGSVAIDDTVTDYFYWAAGTTLADSTLITTYRRRVSIAAGESINESLTMTLPNGVFGTLRMHQVANGNNYICEGANNASNHAYTNAMTVNLSPYADLVVTNMQTNDSYNIGETFIMDYTIANNGTGALTNQSFSTKFYISQQTSLNSSAKELGSDPQQLTIAVGDSANVAALLRIPPTLSSGHYYMYAVIDVNDDVYEYTGESNNTKRSERVLLNVYPLDLAATNLSGNTTVDWGTTQNYTLTVTNNSQVASLASSWVDELYISSDNVLQTTDQRLNAVYHRNDLTAGENYSVTFNVTIPFGMPATTYLIAVTDANFSNPDININNNMFVLPITVNSVPTADLAVSNVTLLDETVVSGQPARIAYTVTNVSDIAITNATWTDKVFLSANNSYESSDVEVGSITKRNLSLAAGASYTDTATFRVPLPQNGTMYLITRANSGNNFYETNTANNTVATQATVTLPLPGDLVVTDIAADDSVISGRYLHVQWKVRNIGENTLSGSGLRSLAYISTDNIFDANDRLLSNVVESNVMLAPGGELTQQMATRVSGLPEGNYYIIVKTDVSNAFNEINDTNNTSVSLLPFTLTVRNLAFNTPLTDTLENNLLNDYKLNVGDNTNETVRIHVDAQNTTSGAVNMIYVSHNTIGSDLNYNYSTIGQFTHSPEIYIPSTETGYYGINVVGSIPNTTSQTVNVQADILPFELRSVEPSVGGNTGNVTLELTGSRFRPDMKVWIQKDSNSIIFCDTLVYDSYYKAYSTFNLKGVDTGFYKVGVLNFCEGEAVLDNALQVVGGTPENLATNLIMPSAPRPNRTVVLLLEFGNIGTTDIEAPIVEIESIGGSYISLTNEGLTENKTKIQIPLQANGGMRHILRPGATGSVNIYCYTAGTMAFSIKRVK